MTVPGTSFEGDWRENEFLKKPEIARALHWKQPDRGTILSAANDHAESQLKLHRDYAGTLGLTKLAEAVSQLEVQLQAARESGNACLLSIGWGGGFLSKAPYGDTADETYREILRGLPFYSRAMQTGLPFPKTRRIIFLDDQPGTVAGWVRFEIV